MKQSDHHSLRDYQALIRQLASDRGFDKETIAEKFMLLLEESGEFAKAARKAAGIASGDHSRKLALDDEAADVFFVLLDLCNNLDIDLANAFAEKEKQNTSRKWA